MNRKMSLKKLSVFSLSLLLASAASLYNVSALEILANNYRMTAISTKMSAQELCESAGLVSTDPTDNVTWKCYSGNLDTTKPSHSYSINIEARDNNTGETKIKEIKVFVDPVSVNEPPVLSLKQGQVVINEGDSIDLRSYIASATDKEDGDLTSKVQISGSVDTSKAGTYVITYTVTDKGSLSDSKTLTVKVVAKAIGGAGQQQPENNDESNSSEGNGSGSVVVDDVVSGDNGETLPNTADTSSLTLAGLSIFAIGGIAIVSNKRKEENAE